MRSRIVRFLDQGFSPWRLLPHFRNVVRAASVRLRRGMALPARSDLPRFGLLGDPHEALPPAGFQSVAAGGLAQVDFVYAPVTPSARLTRYQLANARIALACNDLDFVLVSDGLSEPPRVGVATVRDHVIFASHCADTFLHGAMPVRALAGRVLNLPSGRHIPTQNLGELLARLRPVIEMRHVVLGEGPVTAKPLRLGDGCRLCEAPPVRPVVFILPTFLAVGGVERNTIEIMRALKDLYDFVVINVERLNERQGSLHHQVDGLALAIYDLAEAAEEDSFLSIFRALKSSYAPRLVWICNGSNWLCDHAHELRTIFRDTPIVDQQVYDTQEGWIKRYQEPGIQSFDRYIAINRPIQRRFLEDFNMAAGRVDLIYHCIDASRFAFVPLSAEERRRRLARYGLPGEGRLFACIGRLTLQKRPLDFLELARRVERSTPGDGFVTIGDGELSDDVRQFASRHRLQRWTHIPHCGAMEEILPLFSGIIVTSQYEGLPIAMLEALAVGVPVLATDVGDIRYVLDRFGSGAIVPTVGAPDALHAAFLAWRDNLAKYQSAATATAAEIRHMFSSANIARQYHQCWQRAMAEYSGEVSRYGRNPSAASACVVGALQGKDDHR